MFAKLIRKKRTEWRVAEHYVFMIIEAIGSMGNFWLGTCVFFLPFQFPNSLLQYLNFMMVKFFYLTSVKGIVFFVSFQDQCRKH